MGRWTDLAVWRGPTVNCGDGDQFADEPGDRLLEHRGLVVHIAEGSYEGTIAWQRNPDANVSSHFVVGLDGAIAQMVDTDIRAWTQAAGNSRWISVENAGHTPAPLAAAQVEANARLLARAHHVYGVPLQLAVNPDGRGLGHHSMGCNWPGGAWGHCDCPGPAIIAQKPAILARARELSIVEGTDMVTDDDVRRIAQAVWELYRAPAGPGGGTYNMQDHVLATEFRVAEVGAQVKALSAEAKRLGDLVEAGGGSADVAAVLAGVDTRLAALRAAIDGDTRDTVADGLEGGAAKVRPAA